MPEARPLRRAAFLDRDGTICEEMGYVNHVDRLQIFPFAAAAIRQLNEARVPVIVVTNQSGVARDIFPESLVHQVHKKMISELSAGGARVDAIYFCPHKTEDACECRKPNPGLLERAAREHALDLAASWVVGDRYADLEMGHAAGSRGILVMTGYGRGEYELHRLKWARQPDALAETLTEAVGRILHTVPAVAALRAAQKSARIDWVVERKWAPVLEGSSAIDEVIPFDRASAFGAPTCVRRLRRKNYTCAIDFQGLYKSSVLAMLSAAPRRIGFERAWAREPGAALLYTERVVPKGRHVTELNYSLAEKAGAARPVRPEYPLRVPAGGAASVRARLAEKGIGDYIVVGPGGSWRAKRCAAG